MKKRGQFELSFGMIFSILMIISFIGVASYVLYKFVDFGRETNIQLFVYELQESVDKLWGGTEGSQTLIWNIDKSITNICFVDFSRPANNEREIYQEISRFSDNSDINMFLYPTTVVGGNNAGRVINHINITKTTEEKNPYCIKNMGEINITIEKSFQEALVTAS